MFAAALLFCATSQAQEAAGRMGPPTLRPPFPLQSCAIIASGSEAAQAQASRLAGAIPGARLVAAQESLDATGLRLTEEIAEQPHILLGNINTNRALLPYYAELLDFSDAYHPGGDGHVLRTVPQGCGRGGDALIVGASSDAGLAQGIDRLLQLIQAAPGAALPYVLETQLEGPVANNVPLGAWPEPFDPARWANADGYGGLYQPGYAYALTGHLPAAQVALAALLRGARDPGWYPVSDYELEWLTRAWGYVRDAPCVTEADAEAIDNALLSTLYHDQNEYWRARDGSRIGGRHQTMGTSAFYAGVRLLLRRGNPDATARAQLEQWRDQCAAYFANAGRTFHDDLEGIPCYHSFQPIANEALRSGNTEYLGRNVDLAVRRALAVTDNLGYYVGTGTYEEARPGTTRQGIMLGYPLRVAAYVTGNPGYEWLLRHFRGTEVSTWGLVVGWGAHGFARPGDVPEAEPRDLLGLLTVPLGSYREAGQQPPAAGTYFEKLCLRDSFEPRGQFMVLQGFHELWSDNLPPRDANSIVRHTDLGHIWLYANTERSGNFDRNAVYVSDGLNATSGAPGCELLSAQDAGSVAIVSSRLRNYVGTDWTRTVIWRKGRYHVVIDALASATTDECAATCSFRTPCAAEATPTGLRAWEGNAEFRIVNADGLPPSVRRAAQPDGAATPTFLRLRRHLPAGGRACFRNLLYAADPERPLALEVRPVGGSAVIIRGDTPDGEEIALAGVREGEGPQPLGPFEVDAEVFYVSPQAAVVDGGEVSLSGKAVGAAPDPAPLRAALLDLWQATEGAAGAAEGPVEAGSGTRLFRFAGFAPRGEAVLGPDLTADPTPTGGLAVDLTDGTIPMWQGVSFPGGTDLRLRLDLRRPERLECVEIATGLLPAVNVRPDPAALPAPKAATVALDGAARAVEFRCGFTCEPLHKGCVCPMGRWRADLGGAQARVLELTLPKDAWSGGAGMREVIVRRAGTTDVAPTHLAEADLDGDGSHELLLAADTGEIVCLAADGRELWRRTLGGPVTALRCLDLGEAALAILAATREARLYRLSATGEVAWTVDFLPLAAENGDLPTAYSLSRWTGSDGKPEIVCGNYNACSFVTPDGSRMRYCRANGAFETMLLPDGLDLTGDGVEDQLAYNVWSSLSVIDGAQRKNVGYRGAPGGEGLRFDWYRRNAGEALLLIAAENGVGVTNAGAGEYLWRQDIAPLSGCGVGEFLGGEAGQVVVVTKRDGFLVAISESGEVIRRTPVGGPLDCMAVVRLPGGADVPVASTDSELIAFDTGLRRWEVVAQGPATRLVALAEPGTFAALRPTGAVDVFRLN